MTSRATSPIVRTEEVLSEELSAPFVPQPQSIDDVGLDFSLLVDLCVKSIYFAGRPTARQISTQLALPFSIVDELLSFLKREQLAEVVGSSGVGEQLYQYSLSNRGLEKVEEALARNHYIGPAPVPFAAYLDVVRQQSVTQMRVDPETVTRALSHLVLDQQVVASLGPAINSGKSLLIYGHSGNGKTAITAAFRDMLPGEVLLPYAIDLGGTIVKMFDPRIHEERAPEVQKNRRSSDRLVSLPSGAERRRDRRWAVCSRPMVTAGGELTLADLELRYSPISKFYIAPLQLKANGGVLVVDDFGRQIIQPKELLNRWIIPMEGGVDHLSLHSGDTIEVPFDVLLVFSTNIPPGRLGDEAFFRRIRYKVEVPDPTREEFLEILRRACQERDIPYTEQDAYYLLDRYYHREGRQFRGCHPRDLVQLTTDICRYHGVRPALTPEWLDLACASYFVELDGETEPTSL
ncbi:MAG: ATP-binding protein [Dehalococcoidia bacterium]